MEIDKREFQEELFDEYNNLNRRNTNYSNQLRIREKVVVKLSVESVVFSLIGLMLLLIISFSFGVEKGKNISIARPKEITPALVKQIPLKQEVLSKATQNVKPPASEEQDLKEKERSFVIQAITYIKSDMAKKEVDSLKSRGYQSYMVQSGKYYIVYIGYFSEDEAKGKIRDIKQTYKDSFIKRMARRDNS